jgi:WD40 repeat protein
LSCAFCNANLAGSASKQDSRNFSFKFDLKGHAGAVYCVRFSPNGNLLASGYSEKEKKNKEIANLVAIVNVFLQGNRKQNNGLFFFLFLLQIYSALL